MRYPCRSSLLLFALLTLPALPACAETVSGEVRVIDGDSIVVDGTRIRIWGIDAPEMGTRDGDDAKSYLKMLVDDAPVRCEDDGVRIQGRIMAKCFIGTVDIGGVMVLSGNARDWRRYSGGHYSRMLKLAGIAPRRRQLARRPAPAQAAAPPPARVTPAYEPPAYVRRRASRYPTAPAIVAEPPAPFRPAPQAAPAARAKAPAGAAAKAPAAEPPVSAAPVPPVSAPTALAPPPQAVATEREDVAPATGPERILDE